MLIKSHCGFVPQLSCRGIFEFCNDGLRFLYTGDEPVEEMMKRSVFGNLDEGSPDNDFFLDGLVKDLHQIAVSNFFPSQLKMFTALRTKFLCISKKIYVLWMLKQKIPSSNRFFFHLTTRQIHKIAGVKTSKQVWVEVRCFDMYEKYCKRMLKYKSTNIFFDVVLV